MFRVFFISFLAYSVVLFLMSCSVLFVLIFSVLAAAATTRFFYVLKNAEKLRQQKEKRDEAAQKQAERQHKTRVYKVVGPICVLLCFFCLHGWAVPMLLSIPVMLILSSYVSKYDVSTWKDQQNNLKVIILSGGNFQTVDVHHTPGESVWCTSFDKEGKGLSIKRVALNKSDEGLIQVEGDAKKAVLYEWDGNEDTPAKNLLDIFYHNPGHGLPRDASSLTEVEL